MKKELRELSKINRAHIMSLLPFRQANRFILRRLFHERREIRAAWNSIDEMEDRAYSKAERYATGCCQ